MRKPTLAFLAVSFPAMFFGQFYPEASATWCMLNSVSPAGYDIVAQMGSDPDTLIDGHTYKRILQYDNQFGQWWLNGKFYVRSDPSGRAYAYLLDSLAEYLTADLNAQTGDTIHQVLSFNTHFASSCVSGFVDPVLVTVVVDSIVQVNAGGTMVDRYYLDSPCWPSTPAPNWYFWQAGMGTSQGPILFISDGFSLVSLMCSIIANTEVYPSGIGCDCPFLPTGLTEQAARRVVNAYPVPTAGAVTFTGAPVLAVEVRDAGGRVLFTTRAKEVDLSSYPPGVYTAVVTTATGRQAVRLVLCSP